MYIDNSSINKIIHIRCSAISDLNGNNLCDNNLSLDFTENQSSPNSFGEINGNIIYTGEHKIVIEVINVDTDDVIQKEISDNYLYLINYYQEIIKSGHMKVLIQLEIVIFQVP